MALNQAFWLCFLCKRKAKRPRKDKNIEESSRSSTKLEEEKLIMKVFVAKL